MRRFAGLAPESPAHGFNFCQGTIAEMAEEPTAYVVQAIREFGAMKKVFMVHFRNIKGGYLDFCETFPDEGSVDMAACIRAYREVGYDGILCPDHVPVSELDPARERFFGFALGYTRGLLHGCA
jgi:mannonate dehydratase